MASKIEWTDETDNIIVVVDENGKQAGWYCEKVSEGCDHCYAERLNGTSFYGGNGLKYRQSRNGRPQLGLRRDILAGWAKKTKPKRRFINSMTDTFGEFVPDEWIFELFDAMVAAPLQTFQILTKRAKRMYEVTLDWLEARGLVEVPAHIWMMVSAENQRRYDERVPWLLKTRAATRGLSLEPLVGAIDIHSSWAVGGQFHHNCGELGWYDQDGNYCPHCGRPGFVTHAQIHWVIVGGESGPGARPMHPDWVRGIRDQCVAARTPFLFKQWGEWFPSSEYPPAHSTPGELPPFIPAAWHKFGGDDVSYRVGKKAAGRLLDGRTWDEFPTPKSETTP